MDPIKQFEDEKLQRIASYETDEEIQQAGKEWLKQQVTKFYTYNFTWLGRPVIQTPQDLIAMQEIVCEVKPDIIIECGIAHGGSIIFYASVCEMLNHGTVIGVDIDIRAHNKAKIEEHPMFKRITMIEGSSVDEKIVGKVKELIRGKNKILVALDSMHTHAHVLRELQLYSPFVSPGSYIIVFDTHIEEMPDSYFADRPWGHGNNPATAVREFLRTQLDFVSETAITDKLVATTMKHGVLKRIK